MTVVPPINLSQEELAEALTTVRRSASQTKPFDVGFTGLASFAPSAATVHLAVGDPDGDLARLRDGIRVGALLRDDPRPYAPHVTLISSAADTQIGAALALNRDRTPESPLIGDWEVDRVFVLEQIRHSAGTSWQVLSEECFGKDVVVGRGGVEMNLRCVGCMEPATVSLLVRSGVRTPEGVPDDPGLLNVTAELTENPGVPVGAAIGRVEGRSAWLDELVTSVEHRREGIARHVLAKWCYEAATRGATVALSDGDDVLTELGFTRVGDLLVRKLL